VAGRWLTGFASAQSCDDVRKDVLDLLAHRQQDHDHDDRDQDQDQRVLDHALPGLTVDYATESQVQPCGYVGPSDVQHGSTVLNGSRTNSMRIPNSFQEVWDQVWRAPVCTA